MIAALPYVVLAHFLQVHQCVGMQVYARHLPVKRGSHVVVQAGHDVAHQYHERFAGLEVRRPEADRVLTIQLRQPHLVDGHAFGRRVLYRCSEANKSMENCDDIPRSAQRPGLAIVPGRDTPLDGQIRQVCRVGPVAIIAAGFAQVLVECIGCRCYRLGFCR